MPRDYESQLLLVRNYYVLTSFDFWKNRGLQIIFLLTIDVNWTFNCCQICCNNDANGDRIPHHMPPIRRWCECSHCPNYRPPPPLIIDREIDESKTQSGTIVDNALPQAHLMWHEHCLDIVADIFWICCIFDCSPCDIPHVRQIRGSFLNRPVLLSGAWHMELFNPIGNAIHHFAPFPVSPAIVICFECTKKPKLMNKMELVLFSIGCPTCVYTSKWIIDNYVNENVLFRHNALLQLLVWFQQCWTFAT